MRPLLLALSSLLILVSATAEAVIIASGDGTGNTTAPSPDPGWSSLGASSGFLTVVYMGSGWVLTAAHVGTGSPTFGGTTYTTIPGSMVQFTTGASPADLMVFKVYGDPGVPAADIVATTPSVGTDVIMAGRGRNRGAVTTWLGRDGWLWDVDSNLRWGTNAISDDDVLIVDAGTATQSLATEFDYSTPPPVLGSTHEAQAAIGDSGGPLWVDDGGTWKLAGVIFTVGHFTTQPFDRSVGENLTYAVDLATYRDAILAVVQQPDCDNGLDDDGDTFVDTADPGCSGPGDTSERSSVECDDGIDNDTDTFIDYPADTDCTSPGDPTEGFQPSVPALPAGARALLGAALMAGAAWRLRPRLGAGLMLPIVLAARRYRRR